MHVGFLIQLPHACIDEWNTCAAFIPFLPAFFVVFPLHKLKLKVLREVHAVVRNDDHHLAVKFAETDFSDPGSDPRACTAGGEVCAVVIVFPKFGEGFADRDSPGGEVR